MKKLSDVPESLEASVQIGHCRPDSEFGLTSPPSHCAVCWSLDWTYVGNSFH